MTADPRYLVLLGRVPCSILTATGEPCSACERTVREDLAALDRADAAAGIVRVDTRDEALVERVARTIHDYGRTGFDGDPLWDLDHPAFRERYRDYARAALTALAGDPK